MKAVTSDNATAPAVVAQADRQDGGLPARRPLREMMGPDVLDELLQRSLDEAGGLRLTGEGSMLGELVKAVLERALEAEMTAHLGYGRSERGASSAAGNAPRCGTATAAFCHGRCGPPSPSASRRSSCWRWRC